MAEIISDSGKGRNKTAPRIDLTPMVDVGFLLITFFILTTTMAEPKALTIQMPDKNHKDTTAFYESSAITLIPFGRKEVYYYEGIFNPQQPLKKTNNINGLRQILLRKRKSLLTRKVADERNLQVLIKPNNDAKLNNIVAVLDEMNILNIDYYAMVDISEEEQQLLKQ